MSSKKNAVRQFKEVLQFAGVELISFDAYKAIHYPKPQLAREKASVKREPIIINPKPKQIIRVDPPQPFVRIKADHTNPDWSKKYVD